MCSPPLTDREAMILMSRHLQRHRSPGNDPRVGINSIDADFAVYLTSRPERVTVTGTSSTPEAPPHAPDPARSGELDTRTTEQCVCSHNDLQRSNCNPSSCQENHFTEKSYPLSSEATHRQLPVTLRHCTTEPARTADTYPDIAATPPRAGTSHADTPTVHTLTARARTPPRPGDGQSRDSASTL